MSIHNLERIFKPDSLAIIGASERPGSIGDSLMKNVLSGGYKGKVFPVNPKTGIIHGLPACAAVKDIDQSVDLAIIATPILKVPSIIRECVHARIAGAVILSAGGKEIGKKGLEVEAKIKEEARKGDLRIIGPNCMGIISTEPGLNASFGSLMPLAGKMAFVSQSGAICAAILDLSMREGIGFSHFVSIGSMLDVDFGDLINYLGEDPGVKSIVLYVESLTNVRKFMSAARAISRIKPIVVLKSGRSRAGAAAAASHTGALAGEDAIYDAAFKRCGIERVDTIGDLFDCAELMAKQPLPAGSGLGIITNGGGPGVMAADALSAQGIEPVSLSEETRKKLDDILPPYWSRSNPVDILGDASPERWRDAMNICLSAREIYALVIIFVPQAMSSGDDIARAVSELIRSRPCPPLFAVWMGGENVANGRAILNEAGIPTYETPERAINAFVHLYSYKRNLEMLQEIPPELPHSLHFDREKAAGIVQDGLKRRRALLTEVESKALLAAYGIPVNPTEIAENLDQALGIARKMGYPLAMKVHSRDIVHKSDAGGVQLNLRSEQDVEAAYEQIITRSQSYDPKAKILGVTIQAMLERPDYEVILGSKQDALFGPVILFGMGGIMTEILKDQSIALPPLNRLLARRLMENTKVYKALKGFRNRPPVRLDLLEEILIRLSQLVTDFPEIRELDINPMILSQKGACAVDARVMVEPSEITAPHHLVICPYPNQFERTVKTKGGLGLFIRPIKPEDAPLLEDLFHTLSKKSIYYRFFSPLKSLSHKMLVTFTQIDYDKDMALIAMDTARTEEKILGVARLMRKPGGTKAEFAIVVGDDWQGRGIGAALMDQLILVARKQGLESIWGFVLPENKQMLLLARNLGFKIDRVPDERDGGVKIELERL